MGGCKQVYEAWCDAEHLLEGLAHLQDHPEWGQAPAAMEDVSWVPESVSLVEFLKTLRVVAANRMLDNKSLQQLQQAFLGPINPTRAGIQQQQFAMMTPDNVRNANASSDTVRVMTHVHWITDCDVLATQL